ncbi:hypothetical protein ACOTCJ_11765 [Achromobacter xylosoxidans]|uniref:hypothetical protein n=1 Tax=Alcaligenes xylosoxydans xylosoxydans TaxID=85698 RepID=UPI0009711B57|nr:hypothetical protein [Achromobacter xylosoxidans]OMG81437.1 hypothetical protein BIZ53_29635 [Achromobacter xylosoxidans]
MNEINDGGAAFPLSRTSSISKNYEGMTLRDYFAAKAMQGELAACVEKRPDPAESAKFAYAIADAMLAARGAQ